MKYTPVLLSSLVNETSAVANINANFTTLQTAIEKTLSRDGTSPNTMSADLDMNNCRIINLAVAGTESEFVNREYVDNLFAGLDGAAAVATVHVATLTADHTASTALTNVRYELGTYSTGADKVLTFSTATTYSTDYYATVYNTSTRRWTVRLTDTTGTRTFFVWPKQMALIFRQQSNWHEIYTPIFHITSALNLYVDHSTGNASWDGLSINSPISTVQAGIDLAQKWVNNMQFGTVINILSSSFVEAMSAGITKRMMGFHVYKIRGNSGVAANHVWKIPYGGTGAQCRDWSGCIFEAIKFESNSATVTFTEATDRVNWTAHGLTDGTIVTFTTTTSLPTVAAGAFTPKTYYYVKNATTNDFQLEDTPSGGIKNLTSAGVGTHTGWYTSGTALGASQFGVVDVQNCDFGYFPNGVHLRITNNGSIGYSGNNTISGDFNYHVQADFGSRFIHTGKTTTITNTPNFVLMIWMEGTASYIGGGSWSGAVGTGISYQSNYGAIIRPYGETIPGTAGSTTSGYYVP